MCIEINYEDIREFARLSAEALSELPEEQTLREADTTDPLDKMALHYVRQGSLVIRQFADCFRAGRLDIEEGCALRTLLVQSDLMLGMALAGSSAEGNSCIGQAEAEKQQCLKEGCGKKFCGCVWNSFLAKSNCFVSVNIGGKK